MTALNVVVDQYNKPTSPIDIDMVKSVESLLVREGLGTDLVDAYYGNRFISEAVGKNSATQRFLLNKFWNLQIGLVDGGGVNERYNLLRDGSINDWMVAFETNVLPFIKKHHLPKVI